MKPFIGDANDFKKIGWCNYSRGVALREILASQLVKEGQMHYTQGTQLEGC